MQLPISIDLRITKKCNLNCSFCFGTNCCKKEMSLQDWTHLLTKFWIFGVRFIVVTGGEPTLCTNLQQLLCNAKSLGFKIALSTNGICLEINSASYLEYIDFISIPIDGEDYCSFYEMRGISAFEYRKILSLGRDFKNKYRYKGIKIGTVVTKKNINSIEKIGEQIIDYADVWKLYQVSRHYNNEKVFYDELMIEDVEFESICKKIQTLYSKHVSNIKIEIYSNKERTGKYLFCEPNADAVVIINDEEIVIGNFLSNFDIVLDKWSEYVNIDLLESNVKSTYLFTEEESAFE